MRFLRTSLLPLFVPTSPPIGQTLPHDALGRTLGIGHPESRAFIISEIEFARVTLEVLPGDVVVGSDDAAFQVVEIVSMVLVCMKAPWRGDSSRSGFPYVT